LDNPNRQSKWKAKRKNFEFSVINTAPRESYGDK
jgi:hypothetical protein